MKKFKMHQLFAIKLSVTNDLSKVALLTSYNALKVKFIKILVVIFLLNCMVLLFRLFFVLLIE